MANRVFDYTEVSNLYNKMNTITGDKSDPTSIAGILDKINIDYTDVVHGVVGEDDMALFGELGQQMLLNWENTSANFPNFVENFGAWSTLVAQAAGDYSNFESQVQGIRTGSPLGWASGGMQQSFIESSAYATALTEQEIADLASQSQFYQLTGATYIDTGMVSYLKKSDIMEGIGLALDVATIVTAGFSVANYFKTATALTTTGNATQGIKHLGQLRGGMTQAGTRASQAVGNYFTNSKFWSRFASSGLGSKITGGIINGANSVGRGSWFLTHLNGYSGAGKAVLGAARAATPALVGYAGVASRVGSELSSWSNYDPGYYQQGNGFAMVMGDEVNIGGQTYNFMGQAANGTMVYSDASGNLVTADNSGNVSNVVMATSSGGYSYATLNNIDETTELSVGGQSIGNFDSFVLEVDTTPTEDFDGYYDTLNTNIERLHS